MKQRSAGGLVRRLVALTLAAGAILATGIGWRLARGPIDLPFLSRTLQAALGQADGSLAVRIRTTALAWDTRDRHLELQLREVEVRGADGEKIATVPALAIRLSWRALVRGTVALRTATLLAPHLRIVREPDGRLGLGLGGASPAAGEQAILPGLPGGLFGAPSSRRLQEVEVRDGALVLVDRASGRVARVTGIELELHAEDDGLAGGGSGRLELGTASVPVTLAAAYRRAVAALDLQLAVRGLDLPAVAAVLPAPDLAALTHGLQLRADARGWLALDDSLRLRRARVKATAGPGHLALAGLVAAPLPVRRLALALAVDRASDAIRLEGLALDAGVGPGGPHVRLRGRLAPFHGPGAVEARVTVARLSIGALGQWWPAPAAPAARRWVTANLSGGEIREADARLAATVTDGDPGSLIPGAVTGSFAFDGLSVRYLGSMSPLVGAAGTGTFSRDTLDLHVARGTVAGLDLVRATVAVPLGARTGGRIAVHAAVRGPLARAVALVDQQPLGLAGALGISPAGVGGTMSGSLGLSVPRDGAAGWAALAPTASVEMRDVALPRVLGGWALTGGRLALRLDAGALQVTGAARVQEVPFSVTWSEELTGSAPRRQVEVSARAEAEAFAALGLDLAGWVDGPVAVAARYAGARAGSGTLVVDADLGAARLDVPVLDLRKPRGEAGRVRAEIGFAGEVLRTVDAFALTTAAARMTGAATRSADGARWQTIDVRAVIGTAKPVHVTLAVRSANRLTVTADDAGGLFRSLGTSDDVRGGRLTAEGIADLTANDASFDGRIEVRHFTVRRSPWLAQLATLTSLTGIARALTGEGIAFDRFAIDLSMRAGVVTIREAVAVGPSLGLSVRGTIDQRARTIALAGTAVPAYYGLNRAAGRVPVLGEILAGARGEGIQVLDFTVTGTPAEPRVAARPASLAPGLARDLLRLLGR